MFSKTFRRNTANLIDPELRAEPGLSWPNRGIVALICFSTFLVIVETESTIYEPRRALFEVIEILVLSVFCMEYVARAWVSIENPRYKSRFSYLFSGISLIDILVISTMAFTLIGLEGAVLRLFRVVRLLRLAKLGHLSIALHNIGAAITARRFELLVSVSIAVGLLVISASALYVVEGEGQPEAFGSIPRAMWWATATLTTVGYGDVVPITPLGKMLATMTAITGVGLIAMPAGILASAFSEAIQRRRKQDGDY